jgi:hypothetical protein
MKLRVFLVSAVLVLGAAVQGAPIVAAVSPVCTPTGYFRDGFELTAALVDPGNVSGTVDATGCNIGIYYGPGARGTVSHAEVFGANYFGIVNRQGNVTVKDSAVHDIGETPFNGAQHGVAIYFATADTGDTTTTSTCSTGRTRGKVLRNDVSNYQKGGIVISCTGTSAQVRNNTVTGLGCVDFIAQNGIQFGYGGTGKAMRNDVNGDCYTGAGWTSTGVLMFETHGVMVRGNTVSNNQTGVAVEAWCWVMPSANNNKIVHNTIDGADVGISVGAVDFAGYSACDPSANNNKVVNNRVSTTTSGDTGVAVFTDDDSGSPYTPSADNNKVVRNRISGFATPVADGGTNSKVHANAF